MTETARQPDGPSEATGTRKGRGEEGAQGSLRRRAFTASKIRTEAIAATRLHLGSLGQGAVRRAGLRPFPPPPRAVPGPLREEDGIWTRQELWPAS